MPSRFSSELLEDAEDLSRRLDFDLTAISD